MADSWKAMGLNKFLVKDDMIDYVLHKEWEQQRRVKYDKRKVIEMKILELLEQRIEKVGKHLNKKKQIMDINKGKEKMVMERVTSDESSDHNPFQATSDKSSDDTLKSSSEDICSSNSTWKQKNASKCKPWSRSTQAQKKAFNGKQGSSSTKAKKATIPSRILQFYDDLSLDEQRTI
ncbi:hypothetical protein Tco_1386266 [Tanacetum coccineum]